MLYPIWKQNQLLISKRFNFPRKRQSAFLHFSCFMSALDLFVNTLGRSPTGTLIWGLGQVTSTFTSLKDQNKTDNENESNPLLKVLLKKVATFRSKSDTIFEIYPHKWKWLKKSYFKSLVPQTFWRDGTMDIFENFLSLGIVVSRWGKYLFNVLSNCPIILKT